MPEATVLIAEELERKSDKAPHTAKDGNGEIWKRWDQDWKPLLGKRVRLSYEEKSRDYNGRTFTDKIVSEAHEIAEEPAKGTGDYVTGQKPPIEARRMAALNAWNNADKAAELELRHITGREITREMIADARQHYADQAFYDLLRKGKALEDADIPFE